MSLCAKDDKDYRPVMARIIHDYLFECPTRRIAHFLQERSQAPVYVYEFAHPSRNPREPPTTNIFKGIHSCACWFWGMYFHEVTLLNIIYLLLSSGLPSCDGLACHANELPYPFQQLDVSTINKLVTCFYGNFLHLRY